MQRIIFFLLFLSQTLTINAQSPTQVTDTVMPGYYLRLSPDVISCKVHLASPAKPGFDTAITGNLFPDVLLKKIGALPAGSTISYYDITKNINGTVSKANSVRYVIGKYNSTNAEWNWQYPFPVTINELVNQPINPSWISFTISFMENNHFYSFKIAGNKLSAVSIEELRKVKPGNKVYYGMILATGNNGEQIKLPVQTYIITDNASVKSVHP